MTLVIGHLAKDGLVIASDSQMSIGPTSRPGQKIYISDDGTFGFGLAGDESSMQSLRAALGAMTLPSDVGRVQVQLQVVASRALTPQYDAVRNVAGGPVPPDQLPVAEAIVGAYCGGEPHLFHIDNRTLVTDFEDGFASTGWGRAFANHAAAIFRELRQGGLTLHQSQMLCFRVIEDAIDASGPNWMLGGPIQMATVNLVEGVPQAAHSNDLRALQDAVDSWVRLEAERFREHQPGG